MRANVGITMFWPFFCIVVRQEHSIDQQDHNVVAAWFCQLSVVWKNSAKVRNHFSTFRERQTNVCQEDILRASSKHYWGEKPASGRPKRIHYLLETLIEFLSRKKYKEYSAQDLWWRDFSAAGSLTSSTRREVDVSAWNLVQELT